MRHTNLALLLAATLLGCSLDSQPTPPTTNPDAGGGGNDAGPEPTDAGTDAPADAEPPPDPVPPTMFVPTAAGKGGAAATVDHRGTWAAIEALKAGGNAIDAAVAAAATLGVTDPFSCGIGGGGFMLVWLADKKQAVVIDHRETTPQGMKHTAYYENGAPIAFNDLLTSGLSVGVPGTLRGWDEALRRYGKLPLADALKLAIFVAKKGFDVDATFFDQTTRNIDRFRQIQSTRALFLNAAGDPFPVGSIFTNPDLAATYELIAKNGPAVFYDGDIGKDIVSTVTNPPFTADATIVSRPGFMALSDLSAYEARVRPAVQTTYRGLTILGVGLPSSGGLTAGMTLNLLEGFDPASMSKTDFLHLWLEASRLTYADRNTFMGDPEYVNVPVEGMLSAAYTAERRAFIDATTASTEAKPAGNPFAHQVDPSGAKAKPPAWVHAGESPADLDPETTHITVADSFGNWVSYTCTIEYEGGNGMVVPGRGFLLNNELTDFNIPATPDTPHPNVLEPGKRPRSSMSPTIVLSNGAPVLAIGSPGGATIITTVMQILVNHLDFKMPIDEALAAPRVSQRNAPNATSNAEPLFMSSPEATALEAKGHAFSDAGLIGAATAIRLNDDGTMTAVAEPVRRNGGSAMVVEPK
ncbi:gamma-glutamyltransferase [Polyangium jinanense]|uniref:Glutathione hydrolase proenzyme n=1 Tax=Polyangium jinanense TaxID=2829994 RepID=A0A9X3WZC0_9BACT|nr:gamma-glutamyltransferase [Polyangium jinanense]MDC3980894.1 gamma-glutamyltransferase [Polyangium jinanense]